MLLPRATLFFAWSLCALVSTAAAQQEPAATPASEESQPYVPPPLPPLPSLPKGLNPAAGQEVLTSRFGQFRVSGGSVSVRSAVPILADEAKREWQDLIEEKSNDYKIPITICLHGAPGDPLPPRTVALRKLVNDTGVYALQIDIHLARGLELENFKRAVISALLYAKTLEKHPEEATSENLLVPPWLADGLREAIDWHAKKSDRHLYAALFKHGGIFKFNDLFTTDLPTFENLDAASKAAFRVSSGALVMALLEQPQGKEGFRSFLSEVACFEGEMPALLRKSFPELNLSATSLAKWWALQLASKGATNILTDILTIHQSEAALDESLRLHYVDSEGLVQEKEIAAWQELAPLKAPERVASVQPAQAALVRLSYRCFPSYRPLIADYQNILTSISQNKTDSVAARLTSLAETRATMLQRATRARDYLDWFEITRARQTSGVFDDYQRLKDRLKFNPRQRTDSVSEYLNRMDKIFTREGNSNR